MNTRKELEELRKEKEKLYRNLLKESQEVAKEWSRNVCLPSELMESLAAVIEARSTLEEIDRLLKSSLVP